MALRAFLSVAVMLFFSRVQRLLSTPPSNGYKGNDGNLRTYQLSMVCYPLVTLGFPLISLMKRAEVSEVWIWVVIVIWLTLWR